MRICKHFHECGGCRFQDVLYAEQLKGKEKRIKELAVSSRISTQIKPINYSQEWFYRNKMEFSFAPPEKTTDEISDKNNSLTGFAQSKEIVCGLYSKREKRKVIDIKECLIFSPDIAAILKAIKEFVKKNHYPPYNKYSHQGFLRNLIVRQAKFTNEIMVGIVTTTSQILDKEDLVKSLISLKLEAAIKSIYWIINDSLSDAVVFEKKELLYGEPFIKEELEGLVFRIGIDTFFQINSYMIADFYRKVEDYANLSRSEQVLDLFCGVGSMGIFLAKAAQFVWGVEISKEIVDIAWQNAKVNNIENIAFFASEARRFLNTHGIFHKNIDVKNYNKEHIVLSSTKVKEYSDTLSKAILGSGTDESKISSVISRINDKVGISQVASYFNAKNNLTLKEALNNDLNDRDYINIIVKPINKKIDVRWL